MNVKVKAPRNRTLDLTDEKTTLYSRKLIKLDRKTTVKEITNRTVYQDLFTAVDLLPDNFVDLLFIDPPFLGSGTTSVVAKKLNRKYCGIEVDRKYCLLAEKRLESAGYDKSIQGYSNGIFWERNSLIKEIKEFWLKK